MGGGGGAAKIRVNEHVGLVVVDADVIIVVWVDQNSTLTISLQVSR